MPDLLGFVMDAKEQATVKTVINGSEADRAGVTMGDRVLRLEGQPIISTADIQWVLHNAQAPTQVKMEIDRKGEMIEVSLAIPRGWRRKASFTYSWETTYPIAPGFRSRQLTPRSTERERFGVKRPRA